MPQGVESFFFEQKYQQGTDRFFSYFCAMKRYGVIGIWGLMAVIASLQQITTAITPTY